MYMYSRVVDLLVHVRARPAAMHKNLPVIFSQWDLL